MQKRDMNMKIWSTPEGFGYLHCRLFILHFVAGFLGYPQPGGGEHPSIPRQGVLGDELGDWASKLLERHTRTRDLEWFGPPERNTLRPLGGVLFSVVYEPILCPAFGFAQPEVF